MQQLGLRLASATTKTLSSVPRSTYRLGIRQLHKPRPLPYKVEDGLGKFLPPEAITVQIEWQDGLLKRLNEEVAHTSEAGSSTIQTIINLSGNRSKILAFNYASLSHNNDFFLHKLKPPSPKYPTHEHEISAKLMQNIREQLGDIQQLRSSFSAAALGTFTNGWVWFVSDQAGKLSTTTTYGASTLLIRSRMNMWREPPKKPTDPPNMSANSFSSSIPSSSIPDTSSMRSNFHSGDITSASSPSENMNNEALFKSTVTGLYSQTYQRPHKPNFLSAGELLYPLFCIPLYEHAWMSAGYGVWGKEPWLKEFWSVLDWQKVAAVYDDIVNSQQSGAYN